MKEEIGGMNSKLPELVRRYAQFLEEKRLTEKAIEKDKLTLAGLVTELETLATEINEKAGKSIGGPNIIRVAPGKAILVEYNKEIREVNLANDL